jgi:transcriptional regulator with XRE-family HTH domain
MRRKDKIVSKPQTVCSIDFTRRFHHTIVVATSDSSQALYEATGELIRKARTARKLTQTDLAASVGLTRTSVVNIEKGRQKLLLHTLFGFAAALGVELVDLLPRLTESPEGYGARAETVPTHLSLETQDFIRFAMRKTVIAADKAPS